MKKILLLFFAVSLFLSGNLSAQNITLLGSTSASAIGSGTGGKPTLSWNIPAGQNRVMIVHFWFERDHRPTVASNYPSGTLGVDYFPFTVAGKSLTGRSVLRTFHNQSATGIQTNAQLTSSFYRYTLSDADGLPTGLSTFDFSGILTPANIADEVAVSIEVYGNVSPTTAYTATGSFAWLEATTPTTAFSGTPTAATPPVGRTAADVTYVGFGATTKDENLSLSAGWTNINKMQVTNAAGTAFTNSPNEPDGISLLTAYRSGIAATTLTKSSTQRIAAVRLNVVPLLPLAKPSITGNVHLDTDGPTNIGGTATNGGGLYINLVDASNLVVYSMAVPAGGAFTIPTGYATEGNTYTLQLSKNQGTIGQNAPLKELNNLWVTVGEAIAATGNDGSADGTISVTAGTSNISGLRFGIYQLARPSLVGSVYLDTDGPANIGGTGTNGGGLYVNLVGADNLVVYAATVAAGGAYTIPTNYTIEGNTYTLQLSKNQGTIGQPAPVKELNNLWVTVGEATATTGNDGSADGTLSITAGNANVTGLRFGIYQLARPSLTGTIYQDTDGPTNINGTVTNGGGLYVNLLDSSNVLLYSATVNASGVFTIPTGYTIEGNSYTLQLSKNTGTLGAAAPVKELNTGWATVGEATSSVGNDGAANGILSITAGNTNVTGLRYGIATDLPFGCDSTLYLSQNSPTQLFRINRTTNPFTYTAVGAATAITYNATAINSVDGRMYAITGSTGNTLIRINNDGTYVVLGTISGLSSAGSYNGGVIDTMGNYYVKDNGVDNVIYKINIATLTATTINLSQNIHPSDFAFNTVNGLLYGVDLRGAPTASQLFSLDPATGMVNMFGQIYGTADNFGAMFSTNSGELYASNNAGGFYQFNVTTGARVLLSSAPSSSTNDGANCLLGDTTYNADPYITKTASATSVTAGGTVTFTLIAGNFGPFGVLDAHVTDAVPAGIPVANVSYTAVASSGSSTLVSGTKTGAIDDYVSLPVGGTVTYTVTVTVPSGFTGNLINTALITSPSNITDTNTSNNQATVSVSGPVCPAGSTAPVIN